MPQGERAVSGIVFGKFRNFGYIDFNGDMAYMIDDQLVCQKFGSISIRRYTVEFCVIFPFL